jgi:HEPN domain-containing protein
MQHDRYAPDDPREWLNRARSNLAKARGGADLGDVYLEDLCFDAQQAAEKAVKAVLIYLGVRFPTVHDLARLLTLVAGAGLAIPENVRLAVALTVFAVQSRYPGPGEPISFEEYQEAVAMAGTVVEWAQRVVLEESG